MVSRVGEGMLERLKGHPWLPPYEEDAIKKVIAETNALAAIVTRVTLTPKAELFKPLKAGSVVTHYNALQRQKRLALAYLNYRMNKIKDLYWETVDIPAACETRLSPAERDFHSGYQQIMSEFMSETGVKLNSDPTPPKQLLLTVRVVKEQEPTASAAAGAAGADGSAAAAAGSGGGGSTVYTDSGPVTLQKRTAQYMRRADVELLIRQGVLQHIA